MNFYLSAIDSDLKQPGDNPSIGILLCKSKSKLLVEYALRGMNKPIGVSAYRLTKSIPKKMEKELPSIKDIEEELKKSK